VNFSVLAAAHPFSVKILSWPAPFSPLIIIEIGDLTPSALLSPVLIATSYLLGPSTDNSSRHFLGSNGEQGDKPLLQPNLNCFGPLYIVTVLDR